MSILLDTHVFFWWITADSKLSAAHYDAISKPGSVVYVSAVSGWEIATKVKLGKWSEAAVLLPDLTAKITASGFLSLDITLAEAEFAGSLPLVHKDPFDRFLAAQSISRGLPIVTVDPAFRLFGCVII